MPAQPGGLWYGPGGQASTGPDGTSQAEKLKETSVVHRHAPPCASEPGDPGQQVHLPLHLHVRWADGQWGLTCSCTMGEAGCLGVPLATHPADNTGLDPT